MLFKFGLFGSNRMKVKEIGCNNLGCIINGVKNVYNFYFVKKYIYICVVIYFNLIGKFLI